MASNASGATTAALSNLSLSPSTHKPSKGKKVVVADSWEDEDVDANSDSEDASKPSKTTPNEITSSNSGFAAPPPTPSSPTYTSGAPWQSMSSSSQQQYEGAGAERLRPEKTDAVARRMIASALGVKAPKPTEDQRAYDRALRDKERKRREVEREAERKRKEEAEKAKVAVWED
ncbi:uncharacterized protein BCR38DRAFT_222446 [Pseudomassariella vexata]|uniref:Uncharacterized protein n=1 Tax=Pseudomassariella vexata TaxID=1141098 RepID=A0A1Y2DVH6_9PEZI|nr:uncharacterized protein BCR38DRAFT_222446 [Pseudomassariella vexata]ORY63136.1 hypothetical protein BCR38DRAFT_222446 [Pseudomassariella vexata]